MKNRNQKIRTAEYVSAKHPDKMCDAISDRILEAFIRQDKDSRVAVETLGGHGRIYIMGEVTSNGNLHNSDYENIISQVTGRNNYKIEIHIVQQSSQIAKGVDLGGAGDQGIVIGYACNENAEMIPQEYYLAKSLCNYLYEKYPYDGKTQITMDEGFTILALVASFQNTKTEVLKIDIQGWIQKNNIKISKNIQYFINPAGEWDNGGFDADTGLTGRKIVVDSYGPRVAIGGGAFSGKDWTKVDRSGAAYAKYIAQQILIKESADEVRVELAYAIGIANALQSIVYVDGTAREITEFGTSMSDIKKFIDSRL